MCVMEIVILMEKQGSGN